MIGLYLAVGLLWGAANLGDVPHYGDTKSYFAFAAAFEVNEHRGIVYPLILAAATRLFVDGEMPDARSWSEGWRKEEVSGGRAPCPLPGSLAAVQVFQLAVGALCIAYFLRVQAIGGRMLVAACVLLVALDPLVQHFNLALMTDGLAFSLSLAFCGSLTELRRKKRLTWRVGSIFFGTFLLVASLRVEKKWILVGTVTACVLLWLFPDRRNAASSPPGRRLHLAAVLVLALVGLGVATEVQRRVSKPSDWWSLGETTWHVRVVFRHLSEVYDDLPEHVKAVLSRQDARRYDSHINNVRPVVNRITRRDDQARRELTRDLVQTVWRRKGGEIALDVVRDSVENFLATASFYTRIGVSSAGDRETFQKWFGPDADVWAYQRLATHHPLLSKVHLGVSLGVFVLALPLALGGAWRFLRRSDSDKTAVAALWAPALFFWILNSLSFALAVNIINVRYMIFSHAMLLILVFSTALRRLLDRAAGAAAPS